MSIKVLAAPSVHRGVTLAIDVAIILLGWPVFGSIDSVLYGLAATAVTSVVIDKILYGVGAGKFGPHHYFQGAVGRRPHCRGLQARLHNVQCCGHFHRAAQGTSVVRLFPGRGL